MIEGIHLLRPWWLLACVPVLLIAWAWLRRNQGNTRWSSAIADDLLAVLIETGNSKLNRWFYYSLFLGMLLATIGLAGPTWQKLPQQVEQKQDTLIILFDLSLSMLAEDTKPSRIERARQKITDILRSRKEGLTALVAYAGDAHAVVPLTDDVKTIENLLFSLSPEMMPVFGSNPSHALEIGQQLFENAGIQQGRFLLITDGIDDISSVSKHRNVSFPISIMGVGTSAGARVPLQRLRQPGRFLQTQEGNQVIALLDEDRLEDVAALTHGLYRKIALGDQDLNSLLSTKLPSEDKTIEVERKFDTWVDEGYWVSLLLIPLVLLGFRKGLIVTVSFLLVSPIKPVLASTLGDSWDSLWLRDDQIAIRVLKQGEPEKAASLFTNKQWKSVANYRSGEYRPALDGFRKDPSSDGKYNQGNTLARLGEYKEAIYHYDQSLSTNPADEDALFNKALVQRLLEEKQKESEKNDQTQQNQGEDQDQDSQDSNGDDSQESEEQQNQSEKRDQSQEDENKNEGEIEQQESADQQTETTRDERKDALEQWLRRVPDDPGGLMRRKFQYETKQRLRRGEYENRQGDKVW